MSHFAIYTYRNGFSYPLSLDTETENLTENTKQALLFCKAWYSSQQEFVVHTSGSTGTPKPILLHRKQMAASAQLTGKALGLQPGDKALVCLNTSYIAGIMMLVRCMELQMEAHIVEPSSNPLESIQADLVLDFAALVPLQLQTLLAKEEQSAKMLNQMKAIIVGGAPVNYALEQSLQSIEAPVYLTYGMTETVSHIAFRRLNGPLRSDLFQAFDEVQLGTDQRGCLTIRSVLTNNQLLITNDLVELTDHQKFRWLGRADQVINSGGIKIHPAKLEQKLEQAFYQMQFNHRFFITGIPHSLLGEAVSLFIECDEAMLDTSTFLASIAPYLDKYEVPKQIFCIQRFKETATGKIDRLGTKKLTDQLY